MNRCLALLRCAYCGREYLHASYPIAYEACCVDCLPPVWPKFHLFSKPWGT